MSNQDDIGHIPGGGEEGATLKSPITRAGNPAVTGMNSKNIKIFIVVATIIAVVAVCVSLFQSPSAPTETEKPRSTTPVMDAQVNNLPDNYNEVPHPPKLGPAMPGEFNPGAVAPAQNATGYGQTPMTEAQRTADQLKADRLRDLEAARKSKVSFSMDGIQTGGQGTSNTDMAALSAIPKSGASSAPKQADLTRDTDNRQDDKSDFANKTRNTDPYLAQRMIFPIDPYFINAGTTIPGVLISGIDSDLPGLITAQVSQNVYDSTSGKYLLIPQGSHLVGEYNSVVTYGQERVQIVWTRLIRPDGSSISLEGMPGVDMSGYAGLSDKVDNHWMKIISGVVLSSVLGATGQVAQGGTSQLNPSFSQLAAQGAGNNLNNVGQQLTQKNLNIQPTLEIRPGFRFNVLVQHDIELPPYEAIN